MKISNINAASLLLNCASVTYARNISDKYTCSSRNHPFHRHTSYTERLGLCPWQPEQPNKVERNPKQLLNSKISQTTEALSPAKEFKTSIVDGLQPNDQSNDKSDLKQDTTNFSTTQDIRFLQVAEVDSKTSDVLIHKGETANQQINDQLNTLSASIPSEKSIQPTQHSKTVEIANTKTAAFTKQGLSLETDSENLAPGQPKILTTDNNSPKMQIAQQKMATETTSSPGDSNTNTKAKASSYKKPILENGGCVPGKQDDQKFRNSFCNVKLLLKDRFNYVSTDCGAVLLKANREATKTSSILFKNKDSYMLNLCSAKEKFFIIELCDEILIDTISLANYEFFSSTFKDFALSSSDRYPPKDSKWTHIESFTANNTRSNQIFRVKKPKMWAKYVRVDVLSHYGHQYYCPVSSFAVYGTTQMEKFRYEAEEESMESLSNDSPATRTKPVQNPGGNAAYTLHSYINDFERRILGLSPGDITANAKEKAKDSLKDSQILRQINPPWAISNNDIGLNSKNNQDSISSKTFINVKMPSPTQVLNPDNILSKISKLNQEEKSKENIASKTENSISDAYSFSATIVETHNVETPDYSTFVNGDQPTFGNIPETPAEGSQDDSAQQDEDSGDPPDSYDSIYKTITSRLKYLEGNMTHVFDFFESQNNYFNDILTKVHLLNIDNLNNAVVGLNKTTTKQIRALIDISEEIWRTLLFDIEAYQHKNSDEVQDILKRLDSISSQLEFERRVNLSQMILLFGFLSFLIINRFVKYPMEVEQIVPKENYEEQAAL